MKITIEAKTDTPCFKFTAAMTSYEAVSPDMDFKIWTITEKDLSSLAFMVLACNLYYTAGGARFWHDGKPVLLRLASKTNKECSRAFFEYVDEAIRWYRDNIASTAISFCDRTEHTPYSPFTKEQERK